MSEAPRADSRSARANGRRFVRLATAGTIAALLLVAGFVLGRVTDGGSSTSENPADRAGGSKPTKSAPGFDPADVENVFPPTIVRDSEIVAQGKGTPERALLEWWQAYQFGDADAVEGLTSQATIDAIGADKLAALVKLPGPGLQGIEILGASEDTDSASLQTGLLTFSPEDPDEPPPEEPTNSVPETFTMQMEDGEWLFGATEFLSSRLNSLER